MKEAAIASAVFALLANSEIVSLILILCWFLFACSRMWAAHEERYR